MENWQPTFIDIDKNQQDKPDHSKEALQNAIKNLLVMNETPKTFEEAQKMFKTEKQAKKQPDKKCAPTEQIEKKVEIPFCSHKLETKPPVEPKHDNPSSSSTSQSNDHLPPSPTPPNSMSKLTLSPDEQKAADDILKELVAIREKGEKTSDPVLDTMIRWIQ